MRARSMLAAFGLVILSACSIPGLYPEGRTQTVNATAPAAGNAVYDRAKLWFQREGYTITNDVARAAISGFRVVSREGNTETRIVTQFVITRSSTTETAYSTKSYTETGTPPNMSVAEDNADQAERAPELLTTWLSCASARWPSCP